MQDRHFSDEDLVAFLDEEEDLAPTAAIQEALRNDPALLRRLEALKIDLDAIKDSFELLQPDEFDADDFKPQARRAFDGGWAAIAVAACISLLVGAGLGSWLSRPSEAGWVEYVAAYQALYTAATLDHIDQTPEAQRQELDRVSAAIDKEIDLRHLQTFPGVEYKRAQVLSFEGRPLIQLAFATDESVPIALCIIRSGTEAAAENLLESMTLEGLSSAVWSHKGYEYILIGGTEDGLIFTMAEAFRSMDI